MADAEIVFPVEDIPSSSLVFMRVHSSRMKDGLPNVGAVTPKGGSRGLSVDWDKYSTPEDTLGRANKPKENAVVSMEVAKIREIKIKENLDVKHRPLASNRSHSEVPFSADPTDQTEARVKLLRIVNVIIPIWPATQS